MQILILFDISDYIYIEKILACKSFNDEFLVKIL